jgi:hypothetical protein
MRRRACTAQILTFLSFLLFIRTASAQYASWPPVPKEDLELKDNPANPGSAAMILERQVYTDDEKRVQTEWVRIKVFTEAGRDYADVVIPYFENSTSIEDIRGRTVRPDGTIIPFSGTIFDKIIIKYKKFRYYAKTFTLPAVNVGSVIEYSYSLHWKEKFPDYISHPQGYIFEEGWTVPTATWTIQQRLFTRHAVFAIRPVKNGRLDFARVRLPNNSPSLQPGGEMRMEVHNVEAIEQEDYMPPEAVLNSRVHWYYVCGPLFDYWWTTSREKAKVHEKFFEKTRFLEQAANKVAPPGEPAETRLRKLYARVQQVRYLSYESSKTKQEKKVEHLSENKSAEDILRHNYGYANEINLLFTALARAAGFKASVVEVVDRSSGQFESKVLDASQLNAMVVQVRLEDKDLYFDPATRFCPYGLLPWFESDTQGILWDRAGTGSTVLWINALTAGASAVERNAQLTLEADGAIEGTLDLVFSGQKALDMRLSGYEEDEAGRRKLIEDELKTLSPPGGTLDLETVTGWEDPEQPMRVHCGLHASRFATMTRERMVLPPAIFEANRRSGLWHASRTQPVYLEYPYRETDKITISLPPGYSLEALPPAIEFNTTIGTFSARSTAEGDQVHFERRWEQKGYYYPVSYYPILRANFERARQSDAKNLVLRKLDGTHH